MSLGNTLFEKNYIKFTWVSGVDGRKSLLDLIVVQEKDSNKPLDVNVFRCIQNKLLEEVAWEGG